MSDPKVHEQKSTLKKVETLPLWNVVILDSPVHSFEYVCIILVKIFKKEYKQAMEMAHKVNDEKRVIAITCPKERAELYKAQVDAMGPDRLVPTCTSSIGCTLEPAG